MEAETGRVTLAENILTAGGRADVADTVQDLVEEMDEGDGVARRALAVVDAAEVRHMALIGLVQIKPVPTALEMHLRPQPIAAARLRQVRRLLLRRFIQTREADAVGDGAAAGGEGFVVVCAGVLVAGEHAQARREGLQVGAVGAAAEVVDGHAGGGDFLESGVGVLVVE